MSVYDKLFYGNNANGRKAVEPPKSRFALFFHVVAVEWRSLIKLNLLFLLCCLPVFTIGAAASAMSYLLKKMDKQEYVFAVSDFFQAFKENFKKGTQYFALYGGSLAAIALLVKWMDPMLDVSGGLAAVPVFLLLMIGLVVVFAGFYGFCIIGTMEMKLKDVIKDSLILAFLGIKANFIALLFLVLLGILCYYLFPYSTFFLLPLGASFGGLIIVHNVYPVIEKHIVK